MNFLKTIGTNAINLANQGFHELRDIIQGGKNDA